MSNRISSTRRRDGRFVTRVCGDPSDIAREASLLQATDCRVVPTFIAAGSDEDGSAWLETELASTMTFQTLRPRGAEEAARWVALLDDALEELRVAGLAHRALHAADITIARGERIVIRNWQEGTADACQADQRADHDAARRILAALLETVPSPSRSTARKLSALELSPFAARRPVPRSIPAVSFRALGSCLGVIAVGLAVAWWCIQFVWSVGLPAHHSAFTAAGWAAAILGACAGLYLTAVGAFTLILQHSEKPVAPELARRIPRWLRAITLTAAVTTSIAPRHDPPRPAAAAFTLPTVTSPTTVPIPIITTTSAPTRTSVEPPATPALPAPVIARSPSPAPEQTTWTVRRGDHFWHIAETVARAHGATSERQVGRYWRRLVNANLDRLIDPSNPDFITAGQVFTLPPYQ